MFSYKMHVVIQVYPLAHSSPEKAVSPQDPHTIPKERSPEHTETHQANIYIMFMKLLWLISIPQVEFHHRYNIILRKTLPSLESMDITNNIYIKYTSSTQVNDLN